MSSTLRIVKHEDAKIEIAFPAVFTAEHWLRYHEAQAKYTISGPVTPNAAAVGGYMGTLAVLASAHYESPDGVTHNLLDEKEQLAAPAYVMVWIATEGYKAIQMAVAVPKFS